MKKYFMEPEQSNRCFIDPKECHVDNGVMFKCKNVSGTLNIPIINVTAAQPVPRTLGIISAELGRYKNPCVKLDFTALANFGLSVTVDFTLSFTVYRLCDNREAVQIGTFDFSLGAAAITAGATIPINFSVCDCEFCPPNRCCTYRVDVAGTALVAAGFSFNINQGVISLIAADEC